MCYVVGFGLVLVYASAIYAFSLISSGPAGGFEMSPLNGEDGAEFDPGLRRGEPLENPFRKAMQIKENLKSMSIPVLQIRTCV